MSPEPNLSYLPGTRVGTVRNPPADWTRTSKVEETSDYAANMKIKITDEDHAKSPRAITKIFRRPEDVNESRPLIKKENKKLPKGVVKSDVVGEKPHVKIIKVGDKTYQSKPNSSKRPKVYRVDRKPNPSFSAKVRALINNMINNFKNNNHRQSTPHTIHARGATPEDVWDWTAAIVGAGIVVLFLGLLVLCAVLVFKSGRSGFAKSKKARKEKKRASNEDVELGQSNTVPTPAHRNPFEDERFVVVNEPKPETTKEWAPPAFIPRTVA